MSDQERFDWDDDMDFESLADEHSMPDDSLEDLSDFEENADSAPPAINVDGENEKASKNKKPPVTKGNKLGISAGGLGSMFAISVLVAGLGLGGGIIFVAGVDPLSLWNPAGLTQVDQWFNFQTYPMNLLYILVVGVLCLGFLGSWAVARAARNAEIRHQESTAMLDDLVALRLDSEEAWQNSSFKSDPQVAAFVAETLGSWRLQMARQKKSASLEGELNRLLKAMESKSRDDMVEKYENQYAGNLADAAVQLFDEGEAARNESKSIREKDENDSGEFLGIVQDARSWNKATREKMSQQGVAVEKLSGQLAELGSLVSQLTGNEDQKQVKAAVDEISREVESWNKDSGSQDDLAKMNGLVDRGSKLAFQMAMEVARLGTRGERLLPMTQSLEELSNEFRQATAGMGEGGDEPQARIMASLKQVQVRLDKGAGNAAGEITKVVGNLIPSSNTVSQGLVEVAQGFNQQADRLTRLGEGLSRFTGVPFNAEDISAGNPDNPPEGGLSLTQHDPFGSKSPIEEPMTDVDPFAQSDNLLAGADDQIVDNGFLSSVTPGQEEDYIEPEAVLPPEAEKVYDLSEFGAIDTDEPQVDKSESESIIESVLEVEAEAEEERIYDLAEFGAVSVT